jgi:hypothetical protein
MFGNAGACGIMRVPSGRSRGAKLGRRRQSILEWIPADSFESLGGQMQGRRGYQASRRTVDMAVGDSTLASKLPLHVIFNIAR